MIFFTFKRGKTRANSCQTNLFHCLVQLIVLNIPVTAISKFPHSHCTTYVSSKMSPVRKTCPANCSTVMNSYRFLWNQPLATRFFPELFSRVFPPRRARSFSAKKPDRAAVSPFPSTTVDLWWAAFAYTLARGKGRKSGKVLWLELFHLARVFADKDSGALLVAGWCNFWTAPSFLGFLGAWVRGWRRLKGKFNFYAFMDHSGVCVSVTR